MSRWGGVDARFTGGEHMTEDALLRDVPTGSETGPTAFTTSDGEVWIEGRLRDVADHEDAPAMLAWFVRVCEGYYGVEKASLMFEYDNGPRYRYEWVRPGGLVKLRGLLDA